MATAVREVLQALGLKQFDLYGHGGGAAVAVALAGREPSGVRRLVLDAPPLMPDDLRQALAPRYAPPVVLERDGGHLLKLWHALRNEQLFRPWYNEGLEAVRYVEPDVDAARLTTRAIGILKQHRNYAATYEALFAYDLDTALTAIACPTLVCAAENDPFAAFFQMAAAHVADARSTTLPFAAVDKAIPIRRFLDG